MAGKIVGKIVCMNFLAFEVG